MAVVDYPLSDESVVEYLRVVRGFDNGDGSVENVRVHTQSYSSNGQPNIEVTVKFDVPLSQITELIKQQ